MSGRRTRAVSRGTGRRRILVWGLGRVGAVSAACLAERGHEVFALDVEAARVDAFRSGAFADEPGLLPRIRKGFASGSIQALVAGRDAIPQADLSWICVGTPESRHGGPDLSPIERAVRLIGASARGPRGRHTVIVRSTVPPGTTRRLLWPLLQRAARGRSCAFDLAVSPEFLREGSAVSDFVSASYHVVGAWNSEAAFAAGSLLQDLGGRIIFLSAEEAELLKLASNAFHAAKIAFANEIRRLAEPLGIPADAVLRVLRGDRKLNASPAYLKPGLPFGGSCLPRDLRTLGRMADESGLELPLLRSLLRSNRAQLASLRRGIKSLGIGSVGVLGLGFKPGVADLRESPAIALAGGLAKDGLDVLVHDRRMESTDLARHAPRFRSLWSASPAELLRRCEAVVLTQPDALFERQARRFRIPRLIVHADAGFLHWHRASPRE